MKKIIVILALTFLIVGLCSCNKDMLDTVYTYDYAIVSFPDGTTKTIKLKQWSDYDGEQLQIIAEDGTTYLVSNVNCVLVKE